MIKEKLKFMKLKREENTENNKKLVLQIVKYLTRSIKTKRPITNKVFFPK